MCRLSSETHAHTHTWHPCLFWAETVTPQRIIFGRYLETKVVTISPGSETRTALPGASVYPCLRGRVGAGAYVK